MADFMEMRIKQLKKDYENSDFPKTVSEYTTEELMLPMRDGKCMKTVIYKPAGLKKYPVLVRRTCYPSDEGLIKVDAKNCAFRGYAAVKALTWFEMTLKKKQVPAQKVRYYVSGKDCWMEEDSWEKISRQNKIFYLDACTLSLSQELSILQTCFHNYTYDPDNPVPTNGGDCTLASWTKTGSLLQEKPNWREDVVSFLSEPLDEDIIINGQIEVELWVKTDCENTAFFASIDEMNTEEKSYHIRTSVATIRHEIPRGEKYVPKTPVKVVIDMSDICYALSSGSRIRIDITSSDFPQYHIHSNQPGNWAKAKENLIAHQTILTGKDYPSCVRIPYRISGIDY